MSITAITVENFKTIKEQIRVELKPITMLFGPNSAGKSTIVQALHYGREIFERQNLNPDKTLLGGDSIDLGGFENLVHQHDLSQPIRIGFELDLSGEDLPDYMADLPDYAINVLEEYDGPYQQVVANAISAKVEVEICWDIEKEHPYIRQYTVHINGVDLLKITSSADSLHIGIENLNPLNPVFFPDTTEDHHIVADDNGIICSGDNIESFLEDNFKSLGMKKALELYFKAKPEEASDTIKNFIERIKDGSSDESDLALEVATGVISTGSLFPWLIHYFDLTGGLPGVSIPMKLSGQTLALPRWGEQLSIEGLLTDIGFEEGEIPNLIRMLSSLAVGPGELVRDGLRKLCYVGPLREVPARNHRPTLSPAEARWANGLAAYDVLAESTESFISKVNEWLSSEERLASGYSIELKKYRELENEHPLMLAVLQGRLFDEDINLRDQLLALPVQRRLQIREESRNIELAPQDIGVGISQVLPVVVAALHQKSGIVAIEQPELHIHPAFQVALGDLFIEQIRQRPDLIFILETHSEHLMLRFLRRIRETGENEAPENRTLSPDELSVYFIERSLAGISCHSIRVDEDGDFIDRWPKGFFAERAGELF
jgi:hypothetical protein